MAKRRTPEEARELLMDSAETLFGQRGPDAVALRDVAREAGVSHGLITHYFETFDGLVEAVLARRARRIAADVVARLQRAAGAPIANELVTTLLAAVSEPAHLRLVAWAVLSGRWQSLDFLPSKQHGLRAIADTVHAAATRRAEAAGVRPPSMEDVDYAIVLALSATYGYGLGKAVFFRALARKPGKHTDAEVMQRLGAMLLGSVSGGR
ncbi:MAG TPA: helix-turn-helix domain-containing protein [Polyangiales bacterium]|nr:helix-turn-helix domain-containing protein [Polyangiales bacterium]